MTNPNWATRQQLADLVTERSNSSPSYVNELEKNGLAFRAPDGKHWLKAESLAAYRAGKDPSKQGVADRHAAARAAADTAATAAPPPKDPAQPPPPEEDTDPGSYNYQTSKAKREHFAAMEAEATYRQKIKELLEASEVRSVLTEIITVLRTSMEGLAYNLAPILAATNDEAQIKSTLGSEIEHALKTASESLAKLGRGEF